VDAYFSDNVLLYKLFNKGMFDESYIVKASETVDGGKKIMTFIEHAEANSGAYGNTTTIAQGKVDIVNAALFRWAGYYASNAIDLDEQVQNSGAEAIVNLAYTKLANIQKTLRKKMAGTIYDAAATTDDFIGLGDLFSTVTATAYGEIAEDDMSVWKANVITTARTNSYGVLQEVFRTPAIGQNRKERPNLIVTTEELKDGYTRTLQTLARFADQKIVEDDVDQVLLEGDPMVADDNQTSGYLDALNLNYLHLKAHKDYNFTEPKWIAKRESGQPDMYVADQRFIGQLICSHRKAHVRHTNLSAPAL
jgi:hypothetical protein